MADRITKANLEASAENINNRLARKRIPVRVEVGYRYGYKALDLYEAGKDKYKQLETIRSGMTAGQCHEFMFAMMKALDLDYYKKKRK